MLCYVIAYLDRVNVGFAKLQMSQDLGFSEAVFGLGAGVFFLGYFLFEVPSNLLMHRIGARIWIARIMITWGLLSAMFMFVETPTGFYVLRFLLGLAEAGFYPGVILYLTYWYPAQRRAKIIALFMSAIPVAGIFGNPLSGWIMEAFHGAHGLQGWQWMFLIEALPAILIGIVTVMYLDNGIDRAKWLSDEEKRLLTREIEADQKQAGAQRHSLREVFADKRVWWMCLIYFTFVAGQYGLTFWMPTLVKSTGVSGAFKIGLLSAIPLPVRHRGHEPAGPQRRPPPRAPLAPDRAGAGGRHRFRRHGLVRRQHRDVAAVPVAGRGRRADLRAAVLVAAHRLPVGSPPPASPSSTRGQPRGLRQSLHGRLPEGPDPVDAVRHVRAGRAAGAGRRRRVADAGPDGEPLALYRQGIAVPRLAANLSMMYTEHPFLERFAAAARDGFQAVEFLFPYEHPAAEIRARLDTHGPRRRCSTRRPATGRPASAASPRCPVGRTSSGAGWTRRWNTPRGWAIAACT